MIVPHYVNHPRFLPWHGTAVQKEDTVLCAARTAAVCFNDASEDSIHQIAFFFVLPVCFFDSVGVHHNKHGQENTVRTSHIKLPSRLPAHG